MPTTFALRLASYLKETRLRIRISWAASSLFQICRWLNVSRHAITQVKSPVHTPRFPDGLIPSTIFTTSHENWPDLLPSVESSINLYAEAVMEKYYLPSLKVNSSDGFITLRISPFFLCGVVLFLFFVFCGRRFPLITSQSIIRVPAPRVMEGFLSLSGVIPQAPPDLHSPVIQIKEITAIKRITRNRIGCTPRLS